MRLTIATLISEEYEAMTSEPRTMVVDLMGKNNLSC